MDWAVVWTAPALDDLDAAVRDAEARSAGAGASLHSAVLDAVGTLARLPGIGAVYERDQTGQTREVLCRQYRIFYRLLDADQQVEVICLRHSSRRDPRLSG